MSAKKINKNVNEPVKAKLSYSDYVEQYAAKEIAEELKIQSINFHNVFDQVIKSNSNRYPTPSAQRYYTGNIGNSIEDSISIFKSEDKQGNIDKDNKVKAIDGKRYLAAECIWFNSNYYHKSDKDIVVDVVDGSFFHISKMNRMITKLIAFGDKLTVLDYGYVKNENYKKLIPIESNKLGIADRILSLDCIEGWEYKECFESGSYVDKETKSIPIDKIKHYDVFKNHFSGNTDIKTSLRIGSISPSYIIPEGIKYTFGVEIEVSRGFVPTWLAAQKYNMLCIRDGSVNPGEENGGGEYVTGVLTGDTGINHLQDICIELSKRCLVNKSAGVHLHIGNIDFNSKFLVNSYRLAEFLEDEIFSVLPKSRRENVYCRKIKKFKFPQAICDTLENKIRTEESYNTLFRYISYEKTHNPGFEYNKSKQHPMGAKCAYNRETPRYSWINYVPAMFNTRGNGSYSIEIRSMQGSTNFVKIKNWLLFFMAFMAFVERYPELINKDITMDDIINKMLPKKAKFLIMYFNSKKLLFAETSSEEKEYLPETLVDEKKTIKELINN